MRESRQKGAIMLAGHVSLHGSVTGPRLNYTSIDAPNQASYPNLSNDSIQIA